MRSRRVVLAVVVAAVVAAGIVLLVVLDGGSDPTAAPAGPTTSTTLQAPRPIEGRCMVPSAQTLKNAALAFDGTVAEVGPDHVTFSVSRWYTGQDLDRVEVAESPPRLRQLLGAPTFSVGDHYLVAGTADHRLMVCGFTAAYSSDLADLYSSAFGS